MEKLFAPASLAIIGLSSKPNNIPRITLENTLRWGYRGRIFGVNPKGTEEQVDGIRMYRDIEDLPVVPDLAFCLVPARHVPEMVERCGRFGIRHMAVPSGGFSEFSAEGKQLAALTLEQARAFGVRIVGPNGLTVADTSSGLCLPFIPLCRAPKGGMSIISQSGGVSIMIFNYLVDENIGIAKFASIGNKLDLDEVDFLEYYGRDPETRVICLYVESIERGQALIEAASHIDKPIVVYKANSTPAGAKAAMSHTAALSNDEEIIDAAFERAGILRIHNYHDFFAAAKAFSLPPMRGRRVMVMSPAGGFSVITADLCEKAGFAFADPGRDFYEGLRNYGNAGVIRFSNPLDMGDIYDPQLTAHVIYSVMHSEKIDGALLVTQYPHMPPGDTVFHRMFLTDLSKETWGAILSAGKPMGVCLFGPSKLTLQTKKAVNFPIFNSPEELVRAMAMQMHFHTRTPYAPPRPPDGIDQARARAWLEGAGGDCGEEALELCETFGMRVAASRVATSPEEAVLAAGELGFPVVMKVISPAALHKTEVGGVALGVADEEGVRRTFARLRENLEVSLPQARFDGVRLQATAPAGVDMFVGGTQDASFGPVLYFGLGGIYVEIFRDVACCLCPAPREEIMQRLMGLACFPLLTGARGGVKSDLPVFVDFLVRVSHLLAAFPQIGELDLNPVRVMVNGQGVLALDARMRIAGQPGKGRGCKAKDPT